jgi:hypothetical protein
LNKGVCKGCGAEVLWITMVSGKSMICDPKQLTIITEGGQMRKGYVPHWATCPQAGTFKNQKEE